jgi:hypothetical protein
MSVTLNDIAEENAALPEVRDRLRNELVAVIAEAHQGVTEASDCDVDATHDEHLAHGCVRYYQGRLRKAVTSLRWIEQYAPERESYRERATLLALALLMPNTGEVIHSAVIAYNDPRMPGWPVLYVRHLYGGLAWHVNPLDLFLFSQVSVVEPMDARATWSGAGKADGLD